MWCGVVSHLVLAPGYLADVRVEVVVPALAALLPGPAGELGGDAAPLLRTDLPNQLGHARVVFGGPRPLRAAVEHLGPPVEALHVRLSRNALRHLLSGERERKGRGRLKEGFCLSDIRHRGRCDIGYSSKSNPQVAEGGWAWGEGAEIQRTKSTSFKGKELLCSIIVVTEKRFISKYGMYIQKST